MLLQGLYCNWGLYFTSRNIGGIGSEDMATELSEVGKQFHDVMAENAAAALSHNTDISASWFLALLYTRLSILRTFLEIAEMKGITQDLKKRWLLLQLAPEKLLGHDIFSHRTRMLDRSPTLLMRRATENQLQVVLELLEQLEPESGHVFCVLDEAQTLTEGGRFAFSTYFRAYDETEQPILTQTRPLLRSLLLAWGTFLPNMIISGTGVSMADMETVLGSVVAKESGLRSETVTNVGAFDDDASLRVYAEPYLPPKFVDTPAGKELLSRMGYWLHGR